MTRRYTNTVSTIIEIIFKPNPVLTISLISIFSLANMTIFAPVPEGIMKANEQAKVAGMSRTFWTVVLVAQKSIAGMTIPAMNEICFC